MRNKLYRHKFTPPWGESAGFRRKRKSCGRNHTKIIANPAFVMMMLRKKKVILFLAYFVLVALTMLNLANYKWTKEPQQCNQQAPSLSFYSRSDVRFFDAAPQTRSRQLVYVLTTWRSGSSFFGELFNQNPGVFFLYEPMWHVWQKLYPSDAVSLQGAERDMLSALYRCDFSVFQLYLTAGKNLTTADLFAANLNKVVCSYPLCSSYRKDVVGMVDEDVCKMCPPQNLSILEKECRKYDTIVIKGVRILDVNVLAPLIEDPSLNLKVIHLVRDPRAVASSRIKSRSGLIRESLQVVRSRNLRAQRVPAVKPGLRMRKDGSDYHVVAAMDVICDYMSLTLKTARDPPDWFKGKYMLVRYEDLVENPVRILRDVYRFVNLTAGRDIEAFVMNMTSGSSSSVRPFEVSSRNATYAAIAWRRALSYQQIQQVQSYCQYAMSILGYLPISSRVEQNDLSRSLLMLPKV